MNPLTSFLEQAAAIVAGAHAKYPFAEGLYNGRLALAHRGAAAVAALPHQGGQHRL